MSIWYWICDLIPLEMLRWDFMRNALAAVLLMAPLFGILSTMIVTGRMSFFSDALGHSAFTGIAIGCICGVAVQNGKIMGSHQDGQIVGAADFVQHIHQGTHALYIHAGKGLVQDQNIGQRLKSQSQQHTLQFAAGEGANPLVYQILAVDPIQTFQDLGSHGFGQTEKCRAAAHAASKEISYADGVAGVKGRTLGHITDARSALPLPGGGESDDTVIIPLSQDCLQKCTFTCAVGADEGYQFAAMDMHIDIIEDALAADGNGQILHP